MTDQHSSDRPDLTSEHSREGREHMTECEVRETSSPPDGGDIATDKLTASAHPSDRLVLQLSERWRIVNDPLQWILQRKKGTPSKKNSGWRGRRGCRTRKELLRCIREYCGCVDDEAVKQIEALPEWHD